MRDRFARSSATLLLSASLATLRAPIAFLLAVSTLLLTPGSGPAAPCVEYVDRGHFLGALPEPVDESSRLTYEAGYAYLSTGSDVRVIDVSTPSSPSEAGSITIPEAVADVRAYAGHLYVATATGVRVYTLADPTLPAFVTTLPLAGPPSRLDARGGTLLVAALSAGVHVVDVSTPTTPVLLHTEPATASTRDLGFHGPGQTAFVVDSGSLRVIDVTTPAAPTVPWTSFQGSFYLAIGEKTAYTRAQVGATYLVKIWDLTVPTAPLFGSQFEGTFESGTTIGDTALLSYSGPIGGEVRSYDVSDPVHSSLQGLLRPFGGEDLVRVGSMILLASRAGGLVALDVTDPTTTLAVSETQSPAVVRMQLVGNRLHMLGRSGLCATRKYSILDADDLTSSLALGSLTLTNGTAAFHTDGSLAVAVESAGSSLYVLDVSSSTAPSQVASLGVGQQTDVHLVGSHAYSTSPSGVLRTFDVTVPGSPALVGSLPTPGSDGRLASVPGYLLMTDPVAGLRVYDLAVPSAPVEVASGVVPDGTHTILVPEGSDWAALKNTTTGKVYGVRLSDPANPAYLGEIDTLPGGGAMAVQGTQLWVVGDSSPWVRFFQVFELGGPVWPGTPPVHLETVSYQGILEFGWAQANDVVALPDGVLFGRHFSHDDWCGEFAGFNHVGYLTLFPPHCLEGTGAPVASAPSGLLGGARPNPFARGTAVRFSLSRAGAAHLAVYDAAGRKVRDLGRTFHAAGSHERRWDGRDDGGRAVAAGVYFVRVELPDGAATEKVVRLR